MQKAAPFSSARAPWTAGPVLPSVRTGRTAAPQRPPTTPDPALTCRWSGPFTRLLEPERRLQRRLRRLEQACLSGGLKDLLAAARQELGNPVLVVDSSFRTLAMEPEQPIGIDSWDRILQGEAPQRHDLKQAEAMIENFSARNLTGLQTVPYTEPDGPPRPADGGACGRPRRWPQLRRAGDH